MNDDVADSALSIQSEPSDAGPNALKGALFFFGLAVAVVIADVLWSGPAAFALNSSDFNPLFLFGFACTALMGTVQLASGMIHTLRYRKFGTSELKVNAARLGQSLKCSVKTVSDLAPLGPYKARLRCDLHTSTRSARGGSTRGIACLWESIETIPGTVHSAAGVPVEFALPANGLGSGGRKGNSDGNARVTWALELRAPLHGLDYYAEFALPVKGRARETESAEDPEGAASSGHAARRAGAFAGCAAPRSQRWKWLLRGLVMFGLVITVAGTLGSVAELRAKRVSGRVTTFDGAKLDVAIDTGGSVPMTAHVTHHSGHPFQAGMPVTLVCDEVTDQTYSCDVDTGARWWLQTAVGMSVGIGMLLIAWILWRRRRWWG